MSTTVECTHCGKQIKVDEALQHQLEEKVKSESEAKHKAELAQLEQARKESLEKQQAEFDQAKKELASKAKEQAIDLVRKQYDAKISETKAASEEAEKNNQKLQD